VGDLKREFLPSQRRCLNMLQIQRRVREKLLVKSFIKNTLKLGKRRGVK
jgi:hypothetical protein